MVHLYLEYSKEMFGHSLFRITTHLSFKCSSSILYRFSKQNQSISFVFVPRKSLCRNFLAFLLLFDFLFPSKIEYLHLLKMK